MKTVYTICPNPSLTDIFFFFFFFFLGGVGGGGGGGGGQRIGMRV